MTTHGPAGPAGKPVAGTGRYAQAGGVAHDSPALVPPAGPQDDGGQWDDPYYAACYDAFFPWEERGDFHFLLPLALSARSVLDVGCGTGTLLHHVRDAGHTGRLTGLDPGAGMLARARRRDDVEWILGDLRSVSFAAGFDLVVMTGHAFQELVADEDLRATLAAVRAALTDDGRFVFETRNPAARGWEQWPVEYALAAPDPAGSGGVVRMTIRAEPEPAPGDEVIHAVTRLTVPGRSEPRVLRSPLRFLDAAAIRARLAEAGLVVAEQYGDFDRSPLDDDSPEIVTVARPA
jgi:SAM-dependent methyltransferase